MDEEYSQEGSEGSGGEGSPPGSGGSRGVAPPGLAAPPTGDERVDAAVAGLSRLPGIAADEHVAVLEEVHGRLREILGEFNEGPDRPIEPDTAQGRP
ncbi:MAG: hypothetical protein ACRDOH_15745 [Streptosporangiaceae bacterium]